MSSSHRRQFPQASDGALPCSRRISQGSEHYGAESHNPFEASGLVYRVDKRNDRIIHKESTPDASIEAEADIAFTVGSGRRGRSYLFQRQGFLFQSPISWYPLKRIWDLSPGYEKSNYHFTRPIVAECLFCHTNQVEPDRHAANLFHEPIFRGFAVGCERCHGPGELHVKRRRSGDGDGTTDLTIVNPRISSIRFVKPFASSAICKAKHASSLAAALHSSTGPGCRSTSFWPTS